VAAVTIPGSIGQHDLRRQGDLVRLDFHGPITVSDIQQLREVLVEVKGESGRCFIIADMSGATAIDAETRKYMADWGRQNTEWIAGSAVHGVSFAMRVLLTLTLKAIRIVRKRRVEVEFVRDDAEALQCIDARRRAHDSEAVQDRG
jgi:sugar/nucleoside kinase (ribokinase family)